LNHSSKHTLLVIPEGGKKTATGANKRSKKLRLRHI